MRRLLRVIALGFVLTSVGAFADSIVITKLNANFLVNPNQGFGDNVSGLISGPGVSLSAIGGTETGWFDSDLGYTPGSQGGGSAQIFWDAYSMQLGSQSYDESSMDLFASTVSVADFTFPTKGKSFTISSPITLVLHGDLLTNNCGGDDCPKFTLITRQAQIKLLFTYSPQSGLYFARWGSLETTPEPGTLVLLGTGMAAVSLRRLRRRRSLPGAKA
jgi:hypothetical protein